MSSVFVCVVGLYLFVCVVSFVWSGYTSNCRALTTQHGIYGWNIDPLFVIRCRYISVLRVKTKRFHLIQVSVTVFLPILYTVTPEDLTNKFSYLQEAKFFCCVRGKDVGGFYYSLLKHFLTYSWGLYHTIILHLHTFSSYINYCYRDVCPRTM